MNGLKFYDVPNAKMPFTLKEIEYLHGIYKETFKHVLESFGLDGRKKFILWGCSYTITGGNVIAQPGAVYFNGEVLYYPGGSVAHLSTNVHYLRKKTTTDTPKQFSDGYPRDIHEINEVELVASTTVLDAVELTGDRLTDLLSANHTHGQYATNTLLNDSIVTERDARSDADAVLRDEYLSKISQEVLNRTSADTELRNRLIERHWANTMAIGVTTLQSVGTLLIGMVKIYGLYQPGCHKQRIVIDTDATESIALIDCNYSLYDGYLLEFIVQRDGTHVGDIVFRNSGDVASNVLLNTKIEMVGESFKPVEILRFGSTADFYDTGTGLLHYQLTGTQKASVKFEYDAVVSVWRLVDTKIYNV